MFETMYAAAGIGLAASQVDVHERVIVIDLSEDRTDPRVFINPEVTVIDDTLGNYDEGCLSVPGFYETVQRPQVVGPRPRGKTIHRDTGRPDGDLLAA